MEDYENITDVVSSITGISHFIHIHQSVPFGTNYCSGNTNPSFKPRLCSLEETEESLENQVSRTATVNANSRGLPNPAIGQSVAPLYTLQPGWALRRLTGGSPRHFGVTA
ncbi:hypothetical protein TNCV_2677401 [Trichonephila clavipes]|nr:hypothetical protein TNCV_2677401 [Trichonephila clavipes]